MRWADSCIHILKTFVCSQALSEVCPSVFSYVSRKKLDTMHFIAYNDDGLLRFSEKGDVDGRGPSFGENDADE